MTYYVSYLQTTSELVGVSNVQPPSLENVYTAQYAECPDLDCMMWDISSLSFITNPDNPVLTKLEFLTRLSSAERIGVRQSVDPVVVDFMALLNLADDVSLADQNTKDGLSYLAYIGLLTPQRVTEILK